MFIHTFIVVEELPLLFTVLLSIHIVDSPTDFHLTCCSHLFFFFHFFLFLVFCSAFFAVRQAIASGKSEWGDNGWFALKSPATVEDVAVAADVPSDLLRLPEVVLPSKVC